MNYFIKSIALAAIIALGVFIGIYVSNANRFFATQCYMQVVTDSEDLGSGHGDWRYQYQATCYTDQGREMETTFLAPKILKQKAYLRLYIKGGAVTAWEEVGFNRIPPKAAARLLAPHTGE
ncbi:YxeA family protein [Nitratireductor sp. ZSWI3]|uniref:YxeA family protein n=1 Tax=Nitratireductor sp. ZSWI3 TaxID=2966359 RepID=UPI00214F713B|nr:YxeA family protein [Nitratireductor sp. ZSWI3]MCR4264987.1 YxeA family protein [Nitratireductor sp. ZSWI3]